MNQTKHITRICASGTPKKMQGAVVVEFALMLIPLLLLVVGVSEFGRALYQYNTLVKTTRDSVRHLSHLNPTSSGYSQAQTEAKCLAVYGNTGCSGDTLLPGLTTSMVNINPINATTSAGTLIKLVEVRITGYTFNFVLDPRTFFGGGEQSIIFGDVHATMRQS